MTFDEIAQAIQDREAGSGNYLTLEQAKKPAAHEILEGFRNLDEARDWLETFGERQVMLFTLYGYEVSAGALRDAITHQETIIQPKGDDNGS